MQKKIAIIFGATASGKSALSRELAHENDGVIINADSMQLYRELRIITARPSIAEESELPHLLYGVLSADNPASAGIWLKMAKEAIDATHAAGKLPIIVGGTGLYINTLVRGIAKIPDVPAEIRAQAAALYDAEGAENMHRMLAEKDAQTAAMLHQNNRQRIIRAWELLEYTGHGLKYWQSQPAIRPYPPESFRIIHTDLPREILYERINQRLLQMLDAGALDEIKSLLQLELSDHSPLMRAVAVPEFISHLRAQITMEEAIATAQQSTRNYAKRQITWQRTQMNFAEVEAESRAI